MAERDGSGRFKPGTGAAGPGDHRPIEDLGKLAAEAENPSPANPEGTRRGRPPGSKTGAGKGKKPSPGINPTPGAEDAAPGLPELPPEVYGAPWAALHTLAGHYFKDPDTWELKPEEIQGFGICTKAYLDEIMPEWLQAHPGLAGLCFCILSSTVPRAVSTLRKVQGEKNKLAAENAARKEGSIL